MSSEKKKMTTIHGQHPKNQKRITLNHKPLKLTVPGCVAQCERMLNICKAPNPGASTESQNTAANKNTPVMAKESERVRALSSHAPCRNSIENSHPLFSYLPSWEEAAKGLSGANKGKEGS